VISLLNLANGFNIDGGGSLLQYCNWRFSIIGHCLELAKYWCDNSQVCRNVGCWREATFIRDNTYLPCTQKDAATGCIQHDTFTACSQHDTYTACSQHDTYSACLQHDTYPACSQHIQIRTIQILHHSLSCACKLYSYLKCALVTQHTLVAFCA